MEILRRIGAILSIKESIPDEFKEIPDQGLGKFLARVNKNPMFSSWPLAPGIVIDIITNELKVGRYRHAPSYNQAYIYIEAGIIENTPMKYKGKMISGYDRDQMLALASLFYIRFTKFERRRSVHPQILVNATRDSLGSHPISSHIHDAHRI